MYDKHNIKTYYGFCSYGYEEDSLGDYVHIYNLFIYPKHRRQGKARKILLKTINEIKKTGYNKQIKIVASPRENSVSLKTLFGFYKSMGLEVYTCYEICH